MLSAMSLDVKYLKKLVFIIGIFLVLMYLFGKLGHGPEDSAPEYRSANRHSAGDAGLPHAPRDHDSPLRDGLSHKRGLEVRDLPDSRPRDCESLRYAVEELPRTSVVMVLKKGVHQSIVERAVKTVLARSPEQLLVELLLVYGDSMPNKVIKHVQALGLERVKLMKIPNADGNTWFKMRLLAGNMAQGEVVVFLDSEVECNVNWLEPLLAAVEENPTLVALPQLDTIDEKTFEYQAGGGEKLRSIFTWNLVPAWYEIDFEELLNRRSEIDPIRTPAMTGLNFALQRNYLKKISQYLLHHQVTTLEFGFFVWMCGGMMKIVPCSCVGKMHPFEVETDLDPRHQQELAEGWLGEEYRGHYYGVTRDAIRRHLDEIRDAVTQIQMTQRKLQCRSFDWYMRNVAENVLVPPSSALLYGHIKSATGRTCFRANIDDHVISTSCHVYGLSHVFVYHKTGHIQNQGKCITAQKPGYAKMADCDQNDQNQLWQTNEELQFANIVPNRTAICLMHATDPDPDKRERQIMMAHKCAAEGALFDFQKWEFTFQIVSSATKGHSGPKVALQAPLHLPREPEDQQPPAQVDRAANQVRPQQQINENPPEPNRQPLRPREQPAHSVDNHNAAEEVRAVAHQREQSKSHTGQRQYPPKVLEQNRQDNANGMREPGRTGQQQQHNRQQQKPSIAPQKAQPEPKKPLLQETYDQQIQDQQEQRQVQPGVEDPGQEPDQQRNDAQPGALPAR